MNDELKRPYRLYFAYGSNMNREQILSRCSKPVAIATARLPDHRIAFFGNSKVWDGAMESFLPSQGNDLWGVVYKLSFSDAEMLDTCQDVRLDGTGAYFHYPAVVIDSEENLYHVLLYKKDICGVPLNPSFEYLDLIVKGAVFNGLPSSYIVKLKQIVSKRAGYEVPKRGNYDRSLLLEAACDCSDMRVSKGGPGVA
jgi:gamma-glutamylcyclotransferase